jgi:predicted NBD/HSP70 family sugar kinase
MRKINPHDFKIATRSTSREINRRIALNLVREHQPISRADLARRMNVRRGVVSLLVNELIREGLIYEGATGESPRGRKPTFLHVRTQDRLVVAVDIRFSRTYLMLTDFSGRQIALEIFETIFAPAELITDLAERVKRLLKTHKAVSGCEGIGVVVPGMVDYPTGRVVKAPTLGWKDVEIRDALARATGLPVHVENAAKACALAQMWLGRNDAISAHNFAYVSVSDGVGVGLVINGELVRGHDSVAGEFGHTPLSIDGPRCMCGATGCWEAYVSNIATLARYFGRDLSKIVPKAVLEADGAAFTIGDLIARALSGDARARDCIQVTARYLGLGLATLVNAVNPARIYIGGEITAVWDMIEKTVRAALAERAITETAAATPIHVAAAVEYPRLRGAAAVVSAPTFAAPRVA